MEKDIKTPSGSRKLAVCRVSYWDAHEFDIDGTIARVDLGLRIGAFGKPRLYRLPKRTEKERVTML
jgi:hypothetical protein